MEKPGGDVIDHRIKSIVSESTMERTMKAREVMTAKVKCCHPETNLAQAMAYMWECNCGAMPVVDHHSGRVMGMITDRDMAMAMATKCRLAMDICVGEVMSGKVYACSMDEDVKSALKTMRRERVRQLPVMGPDGRLMGMLSLMDVAMCAVEAKGRQMPDVSCEDVVMTLKAMCVPSMAYEATASQ
jgi:CBS domain-containing protein